MNDLKQAIKDELKAKFIEVNENMLDAIKENESNLEKMDKYIKVIEESPIDGVEKDELLKDFKEQREQVVMVKDSIYEKNKSAVHILTILDGDNTEALDGIIALCKITGILSKVNNE